MNKQRLPCLALALACVLLAGCQDKRQPVKPTVQAPAPTIAA